MVYTIEVAEKRPKLVNEAINVRRAEPGGTNRAEACQRLQLSVPSLHRPLLLVTEFGRNFPGTFGLTVTYGTGNRPRGFGLDRKSNQEPAASRSVIGLKSRRQALLRIVE